jgi:hypothetical protein
VIPARLAAGANRRQVAASAAARCVPSRSRIGASSTWSKNRSGMAREHTAMIDAVRCLLLVFACFLAACPKAGGDYVQAGRQGGGVDHGETNGRRFDFVSNMPKQDDWQIRITGSSMWVSYARDDSADKLGSFNLTDKESRKLWKLIDALDLPNRKIGKKDEDEGYVSLQLKDPDSGELFRAYVSRATKDEDLKELASYLQDLTEKYRKQRPRF